MKNFSALSNVPPPLPRESISSWLSRLCLSQGTSIEAMLEFLELKRHFDFDFRFWRFDIDLIAKKTNLLASDFRSQLAISISLRSFDFYAKYYVIRFKRNRRSRFCPLCLQEDEIPYFRMEWRLKLCVSCPIHECLLEEDCHHCQSPITLPVNLFARASNKRPLESLANCKSCGAHLSNVSPAFFKGAIYEAMDKKSKHFIEAGELVVAAFYKGDTWITKKIQDLEPLFSNQARNRKKEFKWTTRTWRLKIKRHLKGGPTTNR
jgi:RNase P subunit RPR2